MSPIFIQAAQFILSLSLLIVLHEMGHFLPAKWFKTRVEKFYLFFDVKFSLFKKKIGETEYGIGWLPLGGYVKIAGMIDESMDTEAMQEEPKPWEFRSKPSWQRLIIMLGGVTVNFLIAFLIYVFASFYYGDTDISTESLKDGYSITNPILTDAGFQTGDKIVSINGVAYENYSDMRKNLITADEITIDRDGQTKKIILPQDFLGKLSDKGKENTFFEIRYPFIVASVSDSSANVNADLKEGDVFLSINGKELKFFDQLANRLEELKGQKVNVEFLREGQKSETELQVSADGKFGIYPGGSYPQLEELGYLKIVRKEYTFVESISVGATKFTNELTGYGAQLKKIFTPSTGAYKGLGGFKAIFDIFPPYWSWESFWGITAFLSIMLAVLNLLPIPALDGGHVMFLLYEMVSGKKPSDKFLEYAQIVGFVLLLALVFFANGNDIYRAIFK
ncbi:RIP metalloprotease RseP [Maribacter algarum]|uniref:Zinc metalloprotease n=1 Tax=Maribacter algarum (ex Zhang et al. 2020) TaxID=2578118 RepID=A0A5S3PUM2_9FLAO|nr:RIP metalloprotease RseP [Maribacter algarum]TMM58663.1 RIP metalloprotease RseP [Maribacter algarum]